MGRRAQPVLSDAGRDQVYRRGTPGMLCGVQRRPDQHLPGRHRPIARVRNDLAHVVARRRDRNTPRDSGAPDVERSAAEDRKSTRLNSSHSQISYAVFCLKKTTCSIEVSRPAGRTTSRITPTDQMCNGSPVSMMKTKYYKIKDATKVGLRSSHATETSPLS